LMRMASYQKKKYQTQQENDNQTLIKPRSAPASAATAKPQKEAAEKKLYKPQTKDTGQKVEEEKINNGQKKTAENLKLKKPLKINEPVSDKKPPSVNEDPDQNNEYEKYHNKEISVDRLLEYWIELAEKLKNDSHSLFIAFKKNKPHLGNDNLIEVYVDNMVQVSEINEKKPKILGFLREKLENNSITLSAKIKHNDSEKPKPYLPEEKFKLLSEKNPDLLILKDKLNLDFY